MNSATSNQEPSASESPRTPWKWGAVGFASAIVILLFLRQAIHFLVDDAFITFRFSRNWMEWGEPVFNSFELQDGGTPVEGYSNFLWMALLAFYDGVLQLDVVQAATGTQLGLGIATLALCSWCARSVLNLGTVGTLAAPLLLATMAPFVAWTSGGMETTLFTFSLCALFVLALDHMRREVGARNQFAFALAAICTALVRVEGVLWVLGALGAVLVSSFVTGAEVSRRKRLMWIAALAIVAFTAQAIWRRSLYGTWMPNTVAAKTGADTGVIFARGLRHLGSWAIVTIAPLAFFIAVPIALRRTSGLARMAGLSSLGLVLGFVLYNLLVGGDWMPFFRFLAPASPVMAIGLAIGLDQWNPKWSAVSTALLMALQPLALFDIHIAPQSLRESLRFRDFMEGYATERGRVEIARNNLERFSMLGHALHQGTEPGAVLAHGAIGSTAWFAPRVDFKDRNGLVTPEVAHLEENGDARNTAGHDKRVPRTWFLDNGVPEAQFLFVTLADQAVDMTNPRVMRALGQSLRRDVRLAEPAEARLFEETLIVAVPITQGPASGKTLVLLERASPAKAKAFWNR